MLTETAPNASAPPGKGMGRITLDNEPLQRLQRRIALATILIPFAGTLVAVGLLFYHPIGLVEIGLLSVMYVLTSLGITAGFHRHFAHRAFKAKPALRVVLGIFGSMAAQGTLVYWAATHRRHHLFSERQGDPHSPYVHEGERLGFWRGLFHSHIGWMLHSKMTNAAAVAKDLVRDPLVVKLNDLYILWVFLGLVIPAVLGGALTRSWAGLGSGLLWGGFVRLFLVHHMMWTSGSTAHMFGTRPFDTDDASTNNILLAVPNLGEAWHNNHHAFPQSAVFGLKWWQIDPGGWFIRACGQMGWAWELNVPSRRAIEAKRKGGPAASVLLNSQR